jgi:pimeloyl-ACP methyl ester carboxylesterase
VQPMTRAVTVMTTLAALAGVGTVWQRVGETRDRRAFPPPGEFVTLGDTRLHYQLDGTAQTGPTVVLDSGLGSGSSTWDAVAPRVAEFAPVLRFGRPGLGWSAPAVGRPPRTATRAAEELRALLDALALPGPYVLVGWSLAGLYARVFAARYPDDIAGVVLVDASHEDLPELFGDPARWQRGLLRMADALAGVGVARLLGPRLLRAAATQATTPAGRARFLAPENLAASRSRRVFRAMLAETADFAEAQREARDVRDQFPPVPLVVISRATRDARWTRVQRQLAQLTPHGRHMVAHGSRHLIPYDRPDSIVAAIREIMRRAQTPLAADD